MASRASGVDTHFTELHAGRRSPGNSAGRGTHAGPAGGGPAAGRELIEASSTASRRFGAEHAVGQR